MKTQTNVRLDPETRQKLDAIAERYGGSITTAMAVAIDRMHQEAWEPSPPGTPWQQVRCWWHWAARTDAVRQILQQIGCTVDPARPWTYGPDHWRMSPWVDPGEPCTEQEVTDVRALIGDDHAGVLYAERCWIVERKSWPDWGETLQHHTNQTLIAVSADGLRAVALQPHWPDIL